MHDFAPFVFEFHFLARVAVGQKAVHVGQHVEGNLVGVNLPGDGFPVDDLADLPLEFGDGAGAGAGDGLVGGGEDAAAAERLVERVEGHEGDGGGAVGVGDDAAVPADVLAVDLGDDERDRVVHAKGAGVVHHDASGLDSLGGELFGDAAAGAEERQINPAEGIGAQFLNGDFLPPEGDAFAGGTGRRQQRQPAEGEMPPFQCTDHFDADGARRTDHGHMRLTIHGHLTGHLIRRAGTVNGPGVTGMGKAH